MIYGALCRAGKALGYSEAWTYTLPDEPGSSLRGAGFIDMGLTNGGEWDRPSRSRGAAVRPEKKRRWMRPLAEERKAA
jgi:outer membrane protein assembly factor BamA